MRLYLCAPTCVCVDRRLYGDEIDVCVCVYRRVYGDYIDLYACVHVCVHMSHSHVNIPVDECLCPRNTLIRTDYGVGRVAAAQTH
jgi:hypothetical protein